MPNLTLQLQHFLESTSHKASSFKGAITFQMESLEYDQTPDNKFFLCLCRKHIAMAHHFICRADHLGVFDSVVNVVIDNPANDKKFGNSKVADVFCTNCNRFLGGKYVEVEQPLGAIREGTIFIPLKNLLFWNGTEVVDATTSQHINERISQSLTTSF